MWKIHKEYIYISFLYVKDFNKVYIYKKIFIITGIYSLTHANKNKYILTKYHFLSDINFTTQNGVNPKSTVWYISGLRQRRMPPLIYSPSTLFTCVSIQHLTNSFIERLANYSLACLHSSPSFPFILFRSWVSNLHSYLFLFF